MQHKKPATQLAVQDEVRGHEGSKRNLRLELYPATSYAFHPKMRFGMPLYYIRRVTKAKRSLLDKKVI